MPAPEGECTYPFESHPFALSQKSVRLHRDTFLWEEDVTGFLIAGLNQRITQATPAQINRWLWILFPEKPQYQLVRIDLKRRGLFDYKREVVRPIQPILLDSPLPAGYYALGIDDSHAGDHPGFSSTYAVDTYAQREKKVHDYPHLYKKEYINSIPKLNSYDDGTINFKELIPIRDHKHCLITGRSLSSGANEIDVSWIIPPRFIDQDEHKPLFCYEEPEDARVQENCISMHKELVAPFFRNSFGIDVEDDFKIVVFEDPGEKAMKLLDETNFIATKLKEVVGKGENAPNIEFIKAHFIHCLRSMFLGGEIKLEEQYDSLRREMILQKAENAPMDDPFWKTLGGLEVLACLTGR